MESRHGDAGASTSIIYGLQLPVQAQTSLMARPWEAEAGVDEIVAVARAADTAGLDYVAVCDHVAIPRERAEAMSTTWWDTIATLSYIAAVTERVRLLSHVAVLPYRHPLITAKQWMTLDTLSKGRAILGVGAGHVPEEFAALGVDHSQRGRLLDEAVDALRGAFSEEFTSHDGKYWSYQDMGLRPRPIQERLPIWVGGSSPAAIRRAAERGDGWLPQGPPPGGMKAAIARLHELRESAGRSDRPFKVGGMSGPLYVGEPGWDVGRAVTGGADQIAAFLRGMIDLGANQVQVNFASRDHREYIDQIYRFTRDVLPLLP